MSWPMVKLHDVCLLLTDGTHYTPSNVGMGIPFLTVKDVSNAGLDFQNCSRITQEEYNKADSGNSAPKMGDVLFSKDGTVGKVHVVKESEPFAVLSSLAILKPKENLDSNYLGHILKNPLTLRQAVKNQTGSALRRIILSDIKKLEIPLPPLAEQKRIAAILDKADSLRRKNQLAIKLADQFLRAAFLELFGDPVTNPRGWNIKPLGKMVKNLDGRRIPVKASDRAITNAKYRYYGASGIIDHVDDYIFNERTLLIGEDGANLLARSTPIAFIVEGKYWVNNHAHVLAENGNLPLEYLMYAINMRSIAAYVTGSAQPKLNQEMLNKIPIQIPNQQLLDKFVKLIGTVSNLNAKFSTVPNEVLFNSLSQKAFAGEL